jgi:hypothetical protein
VSSQQDHTEGSRPQGSSSLIDQTVGQLVGHAPPVELGGTEQGCLHQALAVVPDPRDRRGVRYELAGLLAMTAAGVLAGSRSFYAIGQWLADASQRTLKLLGARRHPGTGRYVAPDEATLRRVCGQVDGDAFEQAVAAGCRVGCAGCGRRGPAGVAGRSARRVGVSLIFNVRECAMS